MIAVEKALYGYCITGASANMGIAALILPEAVEALEIYLAEK